MKRDFAYIAIIASLLAVVIFRPRGAEAPEEKIAETVRTEEAAFYRPDPIAIDYHTARVALPRWLFNVSETPTGSGGALPERSTNPDSVEIDVRVETRTYRDSTFEAQISGPAVGSLRPTLDYIRTFSSSREVVRTISVTPPKWWEVQATAGAFCTKGHSDLWIGVSGNRRAGRWSYGAAAGYCLSGQPFAEARASFTLFQIER